MFSITDQDCSNSTYITEWLLFFFNWYAHIHVYTNTHIHVYTHTYITNTCICSKIAHFIHKAIRTTLHSIFQAPLQYRMK